MKPTPQNPFQYDSQNYRILERLKNGGVTNAEMSVEMRIPKYTNRISEIRTKLSYAFEVPCTPLGGGLNRYTLKYIPPILPPPHVELPEGRYRDSRVILRDMRREQGELF